MPNSTDKLKGMSGKVISVDEADKISNNIAGQAIPAGEVSDGSSANYYKLPRGASQLQDLISHKNMNSQLGEIFREVYRYGKAEHSSRMRGIKKILFYAEAEKKRLEKEEQLYTYKDFAQEAKEIEEKESSPQALEKDSLAAINSYSPKFSNWGSYELPLTSIQAFLESSAGDEAVISFTKGELKIAINKIVGQELTTLTLNQARD